MKATVLFAKIARSPLLYVAAAVLIALTQFNFCPLPMSQARTECVKRMRAIQEKVRSLSVIRSEERRAATASGRAADPKPYSSVELDKLKTQCPIIEHMTGGKFSAPFFLVYAIKRRGTTEWEELDFSIQPHYPVVFVSETFGQYGEIAEGFVCYSDGYVDCTRLPIYWQRQCTASSSSDGTRLLEIQVPETVPCTSVLSGLRAQYLDVQ